MLISLFALAFGGMGRSDESRSYQLLVSDWDSTKESQRVIVQLDSEKSLQMVHIPFTEGQALIKKGNEEALLVLHKGFSDSISKGASAPIELMIDEAKEAEVGLLQASIALKTFQHHRLCRNEK